ncbi:MAG: hypothetical protein RBS99_00115 [Rhodospirillales bacterium]|nr:hypothetical protein [Rhodospirillales bacterium]
MNTRNHAALRPDDFVFSPVRGRNRAKSLVLVPSGQSCTSMGMNIPAPLRCPFTESRFCAWVAQAKPGDEVEYHRGFLVIDLTLPGALSRVARAELAVVAACAFDLAERGFIHLVQRRIGPSVFAYLAIARPHRGPRPIPFQDLMPEEAA